jgi:hypothetical protein
MCVEGSGCACPVNSRERGRRARVDGLRSPPPRSCFPGHGGRRCRQPGPCCRGGGCRDCPRSSPRGEVGRGRDGPRPSSRSRRDGGGRGVARPSLRCGVYAAMAHTVPSFPLHSVPSQCPLLATCHRVDCRYAKESERYERGRHAMERSAAEAGARAEAAIEAAADVSRTFRHASLRRVARYPPSFARSSRHFNDVVRRSPPPSLCTPAAPVTTARHQTRARPFPPHQTCVCVSTRVSTRPLHNVRSVPTLVTQAARDALDDARARSREVGEIESELEISRESARRSSLALQSEVSMLKMRLANAEGRRRSLYAW